MFIIKYLNTSVNKSVLYIQYKNITESNKIAGYDLDGTLIIPKKNNGKVRKFPNRNDENDWEFAYDNVKYILTKMYNLHYRIVIHTNQKKLNTKGKNNPWIQKIKNILIKLDIPCQVYVSLQDDLYRKPLITVWNKWIEYDNDSFYCGDAIGRKNDHNDTDYKLALNLKIKFIAPETMFNDDEIKLPIIEYKLPSIVQNTPKQVFELYSILSNFSMIINVGFPGCGKSFFSNTYLKPLGFKIINQDIYKTISICKKTSHTLLKKKKSIVIDNTNIDKKTRKIWYDIAKQYNAQIIVIHFTASLHICKHNNIYRHIISNGYKKIVPQIAYNVMNKKLQIPDNNEKIKIIKMPFYFATNKYLNQQHELNIYNNFLY
jgi:bifunctional polynucleotide phosphatase/kinase